MGRLGQSERTNKCQHDGECSTFHFKPLDLRPAFLSSEITLEKRCLGRGVEANVKPDPAVGVGHRLERGRRNLVVIQP